MLKFLVIDDDEGIRAILKTLLKRNFACQVQEAENGQVGLAVLKEYIPDLIFLDVSMPVLDGIGTLEIMHNNPILQKIPVVIVTAINERKVVGSLVALGVSDYLLKPFDIKIGLKRIQKIINKHNLLEKTESFNSEKSTPQILIVDKDKEFGSFVNTALGNKFIIHHTESGIDGFNLFSTHNPSYIFVSDSLGFLDKKIMLEKVKEIASDNVQIFLLVDDMAKSSHNIFNYDGILVKTNNEEKFLKDIDSLIGASQNIAVN